MATLASVSSRIVALVVVIAGVLFAVVGAEPQHGPPNVLLVSIDTLRSDHLHAYGYERETSPTIDALAREGALFKAAVSPSSWTLPAHMTLLTAKPPELHHVGEAGKKLDDEVTTLAEALGGAGYASAGFVSGAFLRSKYGYAQGFDVYEDRFAGRGRRAHRGATSPRLLQAVSAWLDEWHRKDPRQPFFVFLHMWDPHYDYAPPPPYDTMFDPDYRGIVTADNYLHGSQVHAGMDSRDLEHVIALYDGEIRYTDEHLGRIVDHLRTLGVLDDTIIVVTSDHGEEFFEHGSKGHGKTLYDEIVRIPLVIRYPRRIAPGQVIEEQVRLMDVAPTILGLAGIEPPKGFGADVASPHREHDLSPWLAHEPDDGTFPALLAFSRSSLVFLLRSVRGNDAKLIIRKAGQTTDVELYDLASDPGERKDLTTGNDVPAQGKGLVASEREWTSLWHGRTRVAEPARPNRDHVKQLKALGYIE